MPIINEKLRAKLKETRLKQRYILGCRVLPTRLTIEGNNPYKLMSAPELDCVHAYYGLRQLEHQRGLSDSELSILVELKDAGYAKLYGHYGLPTLPTNFDIESFKAVPSRRATARSGSTCCDEKKSTRSNSSSTTSSTAPKSTGFKRKFIKKMILRKLVKSKEQRRQRKFSELAKKSNTGLPEFHQLCRSPYSSKPNSIVSTTTSCSSDSRSTSPSSSIYYSIDLNNDSRPLLDTTQISNPKSPTNYTRRYRVTVRGCPARTMPILPTLAELHEIATGGSGRQESSPPQDFNPNPPTSPYRQYLEQQELYFLQQEAEVRAQQERTTHIRSVFRNSLLHQVRGPNEPSIPFSVFNEQGLELFNSHNHRHARRFRGHMFAGDIHRRNRILAATAAATAAIACPSGTIPCPDRNNTNNTSTPRAYSREELVYISIAHRLASPREQAEEYYHFNHLAALMADIMNKDDLNAEEEEDEEDDVDLEEILQPLFMVTVAVGVGWLWCKYQGII